MEMGYRNFSWEKVSRSIQRGSERFVSNFVEILKNETGFDLEGVNVKARGLITKRREAMDRFRFEVVPEFVKWNKWDNRKQTPDELAVQHVRDIGKQMYLLPAFQYNRVCILK